MNQNTTIEAIREAIEYLDTVRSQSVQWKHRLGEIRTSLEELANELEAAPQSPVEQSEPAAEHPLHAGYVIIDGEKRELRRNQEDSEGYWCCGSCNRRIDDDKCPCGASHFGQNPLAAEDEFWLAPPAVIEPEPELDEFEKAMMEMVNGNFFKDAKDALEYAVMQYREIISRKGDK